MLLRQPRIEQAIGSVDELNSVIGIVIASVSEETLQATLRSIQHKLFDLGGELLDRAPPDQ